jgi:hypothetical protein
MSYGGDYLSESTAEDRLTTNQRQCAFISLAPCIEKEGLAKDRWCNACLLREAERLLAAEREERRLDRKALQWLRDEQNGPPLERRRHQWEGAMEAARARLEAK